MTLPTIESVPSSCTISSKLSIAVMRVRLTHGSMTCFIRSEYPLPGVSQTFWNTGPVIWLSMARKDREVGVSTWPAIWSMLSLQ